MKNMPRFKFGLDYYTEGVKTTNFRSEYLSSSWDAEKVRSSKIEVIPSAGILIKKKERSLDKLVYETFSTIFFAKLFEQYDNVLTNRDFTIYSPQGLMVEYGLRNKNDSSASTLYEFFCPGIPLNKLQISRKKDHHVNTDDVRVDERVCYLSGILNEIMKREGIIHGDPNRRHFILLPGSEGLPYIMPDHNVGYYDSKNGLGIIDVENARIEGPYSDEVRKESLLFSERIFEKFHPKNAESYYQKGSKYIKENCGDDKFRNKALKEAKEIFDRRFEGSLVDKVDMKNKKVTYKRKTNS